MNSILDHIVVERQLLRLNMISAADIINKTLSFTHLNKKTSALRTSCLSSHITRVNKMATDAVVLKDLSDLLFYAVLLDYQIKITRH